MPRTAIASNAEGTDKRFGQLRERAARAGHTLRRMVDHGQEIYLATCWGQCRRFERLEQLQIFVDLVTGAIDAKVHAHEGTR